MLNRVCVVGALLTVAAGACAQVQVVSQTLQMQVSGGGPVTTATGPASGSWVHAITSTGGSASGSASMDYTVTPTRLRAVGNASAGGPADQSGATGSATINTAIVFRLSVPCTVTLTGTGGGFPQGLITPQWNLSGGTLPAEGVSQFSGLLAPDVDYTLTASVAAAFSTRFAGGGGGFTVTFDAVPAGCDSIDFNANGVFPEDQDVIDFLAVLAGGACTTCSDIDFNNNGVFPEDQDVIDFFAVLAGGTCG